MNGLTLNQVDVRWDAEMLGEERLLALIASLEGVQASEFPGVLLDRVMASAGQGLSDDLAILTVSLG